MKRIFLILLVPILVIAVILGSGCGAGQPEKEEILLGCSAPVTGMYASFAESGVFGLKAAIDDINKLGGVYVEEYGRKLPVRVIVLDNLSDPLKAGTLAEDLVTSEHVDFLVGAPDVPPSVAAVSMVAERYKIPFVNNAGPFEPFTALRDAAGGWKYTWACGFAIAAPAPPGDFRSKPGYTIADTWLSLLAKYADQTNKRVAVFASDEPDGRGWYAGFPPALEQAGYDVLGVDRELGLAPLDITDFTPIIKEWKDYNCEILWGNTPGFFAGTMLRQARAQGYEPKICWIGRAGDFYQDVVAWGGDLPLGVGCELTWHYSLTEYEGIGDTTPATLNQRFLDAGHEFNMCLGLGYYPAQILFDAIERAGTLDPEKVNEALGSTDLMTVANRVKFDENQFSRGPMAFAQWFKVDEPRKWEQRMVYSGLDFMKATAEFQFPIPYP